MYEDGDRGSHAAEGSALGFYFQTLFALLTLLDARSDNAAVGVEQLDDVQLTDGGKTLLVQLKHSLQVAPPEVTIKSSSLWRTLKVWVDALPLVTLSETTFHLVTVSPISADSPLVALRSSDAERDEVEQALLEEARRVAKEREGARKEKKTKLPHAGRADGCEAFLKLGAGERSRLLRCIRIVDRTATIGDIEGKVADGLDVLPPSQRPAVARRLVEWWDRQVVYSLCGRRTRVISRSELQSQISELVGDLVRERVHPDFENAAVPDDYEADGMLSRQIELVAGLRSDVKRAVREHWRARQQRSKWINENSTMAGKIVEHDARLKEDWSDLHEQMVEECQGAADAVKCTSGLALLRWTHQQAPSAIPPIVEGWTATYYVRGSYQIMAVDLSVGWHPDYISLLKKAT